MAIKFTCTCGKTLRAPDGSEGRRARCPRCHAEIRVPDISPEPLEPIPDSEFGPPSEHEVSAPLAPATAGLQSPQPALSSPMPTLAYPSMTTPVQRSLRSFAYLLLVVTLVPLAISMFQSEGPSIGERIAQTIEAHPEMPGLEERIVDAFSDDGDLTVSEDQFFALFPGSRLEGALLAHGTWAHWLIAFIAAGGYALFLLAALPGATHYYRGLLFAGLFTATVGIVLLLIFQWAAYSLPVVIPRGIVGLLILIVKLIGLSYSMANNPENGFLLSFIGFTCGVGLCEEVTKAIPLLFRIKPTPGEEDATWNTLLVWGLASGVGFGIAEGIMYSSRYYNGIYGVDIYLVRFVSCVALHAIWAGSIGITLYRRQEWLDGADNTWMYCLRVVQIVSIPMILHGLYDTLLKKDQEPLALLVALVSLGWLVWQVERQHRQEPQTALA